MLTALTGVKCITTAVVGWLYLLAYIVVSLWLNFFSVTVSAFAGKLAKAVGCTG